MGATTMKAKSIVQLTEIPFTGIDGARWNSLHSEREDICETIAKEKSTDSLSPASTRISNNDLNQTANWHSELLQARLKKLDDALDRFMSGSYGNCIRCGKALQKTALALDPAIAFCVSCWADEQRQTAPFQAQRSDISTESFEVETELLITSVARFDTILFETRNSAYRIFLLDPETGRCLVEGGQYFPAPIEAIVTGSRRPGGAFLPGRISVGLRLELWMDEKQLITSPITSFRVQHHTGAELPLQTTATVH
jgi:RNA polymerase-binding transcription factor DksA